MYGFDQKQVGLAFIGILIGFFCGIAIFGFFDAKIYRKEAAKSNGKPAPEHRLYASMVGSILLPAGLFWFAWAPNKNVHWIVPVLAGLPFGCASISIFVGLSILPNKSHLC